MFKKFIDEYFLIKDQKENKSSYSKAGLISLTLSSIFILLWLIITILIFTLSNSFFHAILIVVSFILSYIVHPLILISTIFFLILQWKITFNKFTLISLISNILLFSTIIISIFIY